MLAKNANGTAEIVVLGDFHSINLNGGGSGINVNPSLLVVDDYNRHMSQEGTAT